MARDTDSCRDGQIHRESPSWRTSMSVDRSILYSLTLAVALPFSGHAQTAPDLKQILERLDRIERENDSLRQEVKALRDELHSSSTPTPALEERLAIQENRVAEQAQTKVESSQRFPIRL